MITSYMREGKYIDQLIFAVTSLVVLKGPLLD